MRSPTCAPQRVAWSTLRSTPYSLLTILTTLYSHKLYSLFTTHYTHYTHSNSRCRSSATPSASACVDTRTPSTYCTSPRTVHVSCVAVYIVHRGTGLPQGHCSTRGLYAYQPPVSRAPCTTYRGTTGFYQMTKIMATPCMLTRTSQGLRTACIR